MPALAAESGQQYGGNYPCSNCGSPANMFDDIAFTFRQPLQSLSEKVDLVLGGKFGKNSACRPFASLTKAELAYELAVRNLNSLGDKDELTKRLQHELGVRVPTLLFAVADLGLAKGGFY